MEEKTYHNRLIHLLFNTCSKVIRELLPFLIRNDQDHANLSVNEFVQKNKYKILRKRVGLKHDDILFPIRNRPTDIQMWDLQLLCFIVYDIFMPGEEIRHDVDILRRIRNELCHGPSTSIEKDVYDKKVKMILEINNKLLDRIGDKNFKQEMLAETEDVINDRINITEALDVLKDWLEMDKKLLKEKCTFTEEQRNIVTYLKSLFQSEKGKQIQATKLVLNMKNCESEQEDIVCRRVVEVINRKKEQSPILQSQTDEQTAELDRIIEETFKELFPRGIVPVTAELGCVVIFVTAETFMCLEQLWTRCVNGELNQCLYKLQSYLRDIYQNKVNVDIILPENEFWEIIEGIVDDLKVKLPEGSRLELPEPADINDDDEETLVAARNSCLEGRVADVHVRSSSSKGTTIELILKPQTHAEMNHLTEYSKSGQLESNFQSMKKKLKDHLKLKNFEINAKMSVLDSCEQTVQSSSEEIDIPRDEQIVQSSSEEIDIPITTDVTGDKMVTRNGLHISVGTFDTVKTQENLLLLWTTKSQTLVSFPDELDIFPISLRRALIDKSKSKYTHGIRNGEVVMCKETSGYGAGLGAVCMASISDDWNDTCTRDISRAVRKCLIKADSGLYLSVVFTSLRNLGEHFCTYETIKAMFQAVLEFSYIHPKKFVKYVYFSISPDDLTNIKLCLNGLHELKKEEKRLYERSEHKTWKKDVVTQNGMHISIADHKTFELKKKAFYGQLTYRNTGENHHENVDGKAGSVTKSGLQISVVEDEPFELKSQGDILVIFVETQKYLELGMFGENGLQKKLMEMHPHGLGFRDVVTSGKPNRLDFKNVYVTRPIPLFIEEKVTKCLEKAATCNHRTVVFIVPEDIVNDVLVQIMFRAAAVFDHEHSDSSIKDVQFLVFQDKEIKLQIL